MKSGKTDNVTNQAKSCHTSEVAYAARNDNTTGVAKNAKGLL